MSKVMPYLFFDGNCAQAMRFYEKCLGGKLEMFPYGEAPMPEFKAVKDRIMHAALNGDSFNILAADTMPGTSLAAGDMVQIFLSFATVEETERAFRELSSGGKVEMPLQKTFWSAGFGMLTDPFGIHWMLGCEQPG